MFASHLNTDLIPTWRLRRIDCPPLSIPDRLPGRDFGEAPACVLMSTCAPYQPAPRISLKLRRGPKFTRRRTAGNKTPARSIRPVAKVQADVASIILAIPQRLYLGQSNTHVSAASDCAGQCAVDAGLRHLFGNLDVRMTWGAADCRARVSASRRFLSGRRLGSPTTGLGQNSSNSRREP